MTGVSSLNIHTLLSRAHSVHVAGLLGASNRLLASVQKQRQKSFLCSPAWEPMRHGLSSPFFHPFHVKNSFELLGASDWLRASIQAQKNAGNSLENKESSVSVRGEMERPSCTWPRALLVGFHLPETKTDSVSILVCGARWHHPYVSCSNCSRGGTPSDPRHPRRLFSTTSASNLDRQ